jgi:hypothetical protein
MWRRGNLDNWILTLEQSAIGRFPLATYYNYCLFLGKLRCKLNAALKKRRKDENGEIFGDRLEMFRVTNHHRQGSAGDVSRIL